MTHCSKFDNSISIDKDNWAVTVYCNSHCSHKTANFVFGNHHALIAIEGVEKTGDVFRQFIHLKGPNNCNNSNIALFLGSNCYCFHGRIAKVKIEPAPDGEYRYTHKSKTWLIIAEKVITMRAKAQEEQDNPAKFPIPFSFFGNQSILPPNLEVFVIDDNPFIVAISKCDKYLFTMLYDKVLKCRERGIELLENRCYYPGSILGKFGFDAVKESIDELSLSVKNHNATTFEKLSEFLNPQNSPFSWQKLLSSEKIEKIKTLFYENQTAAERQRVIENFTTDEKEFYFILSEKVEAKLDRYNREILAYSDRIHSLVGQLLIDHPILTESLQNFTQLFKTDPLAAYRQLLSMIDKSTQLVPIKPDSCLTWARKKLKIVDIELPDVGLEALVSPTKMYLERMEKTLQAIYKNASDEKFLFDIKISGNELSFKVQPVLTMGTQIDPGIRTFSFEMLSVFDSRFEIFKHLDNREEEKAIKIFNTFPLFFQNCFRSTGFIEFIIQQNRATYINFFVNQGVVFNYDNGSVLWFAYHQKSFEALGALLNDPLVELRAVSPYYGRTLLHQIIINGHNSLLKLFCRKIEERWPSFYLSFFSQTIPLRRIDFLKGLDALDLAIKYNTPAASFLIEKGMDVEKKIPKWAQDINQKKYEDSEPAYSFISRVFGWGFKRVLTAPLKMKLLSHCVSLNDSLAYSAGVHLITNQILPYSKDHLIDDNGNGPLLTVLKHTGKLSQEQILHLVDLLLSGSFPDDINQANDQGETPLIYAACNNFSILEVLLQKNGISINQQDKNGNTALHHAVKEGGKRRITALAECKNVDLNIQNGLGQTPLHLTCDKNIIKFLKDAGADDLIIDNDGIASRDIHEQNDLLFKLKYAIGL